MSSRIARTHIVVPHPPTTISATLDPLQRNLFGESASIQAGIRTLRIGPPDIKRRFSPPFQRHEEGLAQIETRDAEAGGTAGSAWCANRQDHRSRMRVPRR